MNPIQEKALERLIEKQTKSRKDITKILVRDFPIEEDIADLIAFDATNQAVGTKAIDAYNKIQFRRKAKDFIMNFGKVALRSLLYILPTALLLFIIFWVVTGMYACA